MLRFESLLKQHYVLLFKIHLGFFLFIIDFSFKAVSSFFMSI